MFECCREKMPDGSWWCINDMTSCLYNDGHNECVHPGESVQPLEEDEAQTLRRLADYCAKITDEAFISAIRELGYSKAVILPETRKVIVSNIHRVINGCSDRSSISLDERCVNFFNCLGKKVSCNFCRNRRDRKES